MLKKLIIKPLILFLLLSQFATIAHAIDHQFTIEGHEQCLICLHDIDSKNLLFDATGTINLDFYSYEKIDDESYLVQPSTFSLYNIRSPPTIHI